MTEFISSRAIKGLSRWLVAAVLAATSLAAQAVLALEGRDINGNPVAANASTAVFEYDPNLNITWLRDWNYARTSGYDSDGAMFWGPATAADTAMNWAANLIVGTFGGWMLPSALNQDGTGPCLGYNCTGSEMGYLWYTELGNAAGGPMTNTGPFQNVQSSLYWSSTAYAPGPTGLAWCFATPTGRQIYVGCYDLPDYALAVRPGDVAAAPEPGTLALLGLGLAGLAASRRRRQ